LEIEKLLYTVRVDKILLRNCINAIVSLLLYFYQATVKVYYVSCKDGLKYYIKFVYEDNFYVL